MENIARQANIANVSIVPLWNWNIQGDVEQTVNGRFNRTFMELKYFKILQIMKTNFASFNRTFMELKFR